MKVFKNKNIIEQKIAKVTDLTYIKHISSITFQDIRLLKEFSVSVFYNKITFLNKPLYCDRINPNIVNLL
jgi:hypothetical protein